MNGLIGFIEPRYFYGLMSIGIVFIIHLLKRPKTIHLVFSTLRFFNESAVEKTRTRLLKKLLLFLVRIALIVVLTVLFTSPFPRNDPLYNLHNPMSTIFVWIDPTPSMGYIHNNLSITERAYSLIDSIIAPRSDDHRVLLYDGNRSAFIPYPPADFPVAGRNTSLRLQQMGEAFIRSTRGNKNPYLLLLLSDFQKTTTEAVEALFSKKSMRHIPAVFVSLAPENPWNATIKIIRFHDGNERSVSSQLSMSKEGNVAGVLSAKYGNVASLSRMVELAPEVDTVMSISFPSVAVQSEWGSVSFHCDDPLQFDNMGFFIAGSRQDTIIISAEDTITNYPLKAAITTVASSLFSNVIVCTHNDISTELCRSAAMIIINGGDGARRAMQIAQQTPVLKKQAIITVYDSASTSATESIQWKQNVVPLSVTLPDTVSNLWRGFPLLYCNEVTINGYHAGISGVPLLSMTNGKPLVTLSVENNRGVLISVATPLGITTSNNLFTTAFYVPFVDRLLRYASAALENREERWVAGKPIKNPYYGNVRPARIVAMNGDKSMLLWQQHVFILDNPGVYKVYPIDGSVGSSYLKIVEVDSLESNLDYRKPVTNKRPGQERIVVSSVDVLNYLQRRSTLAYILIPWILFVLLLSTELLLTWRYSRKPLQ